MATTTVIRCEDCGADYETQRSNTKYCAKCRLLRDLNFQGSKRGTCWICNKEFLPIRRNEDACGSCTYKPQKHGITECRFCGETKVRVIGDVDVCHDCARDPGQRPRFFDGLRKGQKERINGQA